MDGMIIDPFQFAAGELWTPAQLNPIARYLEPTTAAGTITSIADRTGNGWTLNQFLGAQRPTIDANVLNGKSVITFAGNNSIATTANFTLTGNAAWTVLIVFRKTVAANGSAFGWGSAVSSLGAVGLYNFPSPSNVNVIAYAGNNNFVIETIPLNAWNLYVFTKSPGAINATSTARLNGVNTALTGHSINTPNIQAGKLALGRWADFSFDQLIGSVAEFVVIPSAASLADIQRLEGYAASSQAWGLAASLPSDHPYKNSPPTV
jgi:hypothetical protein